MDDEIAPIKIVFEPKVQSSQTRPGSRAAPNEQRPILPRIQIRLDRPQRARGGHGRAPAVRRVPPRRYQQRRQAPPQGRRPRRRRHGGVAGARGPPREGRQAGLGGRGRAELAAQRGGPGGGAADVEGGRPQRGRGPAVGAQGVAGGVGRFLVLHGGPAVGGEGADLGGRAAVALQWGSTRMSYTDTCGE